MAELRGVSQQAHLSRLALLLPVKHVPQLHVPAGCVGGFNPAAAQSKLRVEGDGAGVKR
jgi:hypothetical protein